MEGGKVKARPKPPGHDLGVTMTNTKSVLKDKI